MISDGSLLYLPQVVDLPWIDHWFSFQHVVNLTQAVK